MFRLSLVIWIFFTFDTTICNAVMKPVFRNIGCEKYWVRSLTHPEDHEDGNELSEAERDTELEGCKGRNHGGSALFDHLWDATDVDISGG